MVIRSPGCARDEIMLECPGLTRNRVCCELEHMSRRGQGRLTYKGARGWRVLTQRHVGLRAPREWNGRRIAGEMSGTHRP